MSDPILTVLKFFLLAVLWLFFLRVLRSVWVDIRTTARAADAAGGTLPARPRVAAPAPPAAAAVTTGIAAAPVGRRGRSPAPPVAPSPAPAGPARLRVVEPADAAGRHFEVDGEALVGRSSSAAISLSGDSYVSSTHARLWRDQGQLWAEDLGSTNGSELNGRPLQTATRLKTGDRLQFGRTILEVV